ncbi:putative peptidase S15 domain-containing protein [Phytophthora infestans]|uniref:Putative peptidase S15 domain-containing protein n=1 Tax=Phytophthora infestans TaxID=4787 RepID=A0A8S9TX87_PHYIN|nr:putative peptidase S15 domain-containing protein [Phytophthora infestans]
MVGTRIAAALGVIAVARTMTASAQNMSFGAANFYRSNNVTIQPITFSNQFKMSVASNLFTPKSLDTNGSAPAIIVGHPMGAVKEQSANLYATKMAEEGFVTVSIDLSYWGGSEGEPRNAASPDLGSFAISAAKIDSRIKAIATSLMYDMGANNRNGLRHAQTIEQRKEIIDLMSHQRSIEAAGARCSIRREFYDFYRTVRGEYTPPGSSPNVTTHLTLSSAVKFMNFYPFNDIDTISLRPLLFVTGDQAHSREFSEDAYAGAAEPKELYWVAGAGHVDLYDRVDLIPFDKFAEFFTAGLAVNASGSN